jgi:hypothetical protein
LNKRGDEPRSLLRRLLKRADERTSQEAGPSPDAVAEPAAPRRSAGEASPVRPTSPETHSPAEPIVPQARATMSIEIPQQITGVEERLQAEEALEKLRKKTAQVANEFSEGKINRAQFTAMYAYYNERRVIVERLLARDPGTQAWQQVVRPGHTSFLRQHFEARPLAYGIYSLGSDDVDHPITSQGNYPLPSDVIKPILTALKVVLRTHSNARPLSPLRKAVDNGQWITIVPGRYTVAFALFSLEPSAQQFTRVQDLHRDFERANRIALDRGIRVPEQLVFPHRALFEKADQE